MRTLSALLQSRSGHSIRRWARVLAYTVVIAIVLKLILPLVWDFLCKASLAYSPIFIGLVTWVLTVILFYVAIDLLHIRQSQLRSMLRYPPLWSAAPLACVFAATGEDLPSGVCTNTVAPDRQHFYLIAFVLLALGVAILFRWLLESGRARPQEPSATRHQGGISWQDISNWISAGERPITSAERDLFQHHRVAKRIAHTVGAEGRPLALLGGFGTGKTSILNLARVEMGRITPIVIVASVDAWAVPRPEDVPRLALNQIVAALDHYIDTTELRTLPLTYQRLLAAEPTGRLARIFGLEAATDSIDAIRRLTPILEVLEGQARVDR